MYIYIYIYTHTHTHVYRPLGIPAPGAPGCRAVAGEGGEPPPCDMIQYNVLYYLLYIYIYIYIYIYLSLCLYMYIYIYTHTIVL